MNFFFLSSGRTTKMRLFRFGYSRAGANLRRRPVSFTSLARASSEKKIEKKIHFDSNFGERSCGPPIDQFNCYFQLYLWPKERKKTFNSTRVLCILSDDVWVVSNFFDSAPISPTPIRRSPISSFLAGTIRTHTRLHYIIVTAELFAH